MSAMLFLLLLILGALLATVGSIIGVVDAFRVSALWGILALLVPFALLVFCVKFWGQRKWARNSLLMSLVGLLLMILPISLGGGLAFLNAGDATDQELEDFAVDGDDPVTGDATTSPDDATAEISAATDGEAELFEEAMLPGLPTAAEIARAELLPSTDPNERFNEIDKERNDPYAFVPIPPPQKAPPPAPENAGGGGGLPSPTNQPAGASPAPRPGVTAGGGSTAPGGGLPTAPTELPALPEPTIIAAQVQVTGVANVDGKSYAIVKAPNEPTSRYVQVGDRIANNTILVKRIENPSGSSPVVILEERGQEVALPVGANASPNDAPTNDGAVTEDVAALPILPPIQ